DAEQASSYRTLLITFREGKAQIAADLPDLIVPRKDGSWRVGTLHKGPAEQWGYQEFVYAAPAGSVPHAVGEYHPENPDWNCSETDQATIEFVNPDLVSVSYFTEPACSLQVELRHGTYKLDELEKELDIAGVLGAAAWNAEKKSDAAAKANDVSSDCLGVSKPDATNWGIERAGRLPGSLAKSWVLASDFNTPHVCRGGDTYEIKFPIPESLTGSTYHADTLSLILQSKVAKENYILSGEALLNPAGDFLVSFGYGDPVRVFAIRPQGVEPKPALSVPTNLAANVVMVQWALGRHVGEWESELQLLQKTRLPEPTVATGKPQGN
ncbi:MAG: hypothetical protein ABSE62_16920, partial [Chthoniobacteraceae bacterium]